MLVASASGLDPQAAEARTSVGKIEKEWEKESSPAFTKSFRSPHTFSSNYDTEQERLINKLRNVS